MPQQQGEQHNICKASLLRMPILVRSEPPKNASKDVVAVHKMAAALLTDSGLRNVWVTVKETAGGKRFYEHRLTEMKSPAVDLGAMPSGEATTPRTAGDRISIDGLFPGLKGTMADQAEKYARKHKHTPASDHSSHACDGGKTKCPSMLMPTK